MSCRQSSGISIFLAIVFLLFAGLASAQPVANQQAEATDDDEAKCQAGGEDCPEPSAVADPNGNPPWLVQYACSGGGYQQDLDNYASDFAQALGGEAYVNGSVAELEWSPPAGTTEFCYVEHSPELYSSLLSYEVADGYAKILRFENPAAGIDAQYQPSTVKVYLNWSPFGNPEEEIIEINPTIGEDVNTLVARAINNSSVYMATVMHQWILVEKAPPIYPPNPPPLLGMFGIGIYNDDVNNLTTGVALSAGPHDFADCVPKLPNPGGK